MNDWQRFILNHGFRADVHVLAHVLGKPVEVVQKYRSGITCVRLKSRRTFEELFALFHGREPDEADWPQPRKSYGGGYEWQSRELALLATLVGTTGTPEIARILTERLRTITGSPRAIRTKESVQLAMNRIGLQSRDLVGGISVKEAGLEIGSIAAITHATQTGLIKTKRVGRMLMIPHEEWAKWKASRVGPPVGYVQLSTLREQLGIKSDKLSEFARMGLIPTAVQCLLFGAIGAHTTKFGSWYVSEGTAKQLLSDRRAGLPMPWHGKALNDNLKTTFKLWMNRKHPAHCETCSGIWGEQGPPLDFDDYAKRYPALALGQKRHLTMIWNPGMTIQEVAISTQQSEAQVRIAIGNGALKASVIDEVQYVTKTSAITWKTRGCPDGSNIKSWTTLAFAARLYLFTTPELQSFIADGTLAFKIGENGPMRGQVFVSKAQCASLREQIGFSETEAARRAGITVERLRHLLNGLDWRGTGTIPMPTLQAVIKRLKSRSGFTLDEAAIELNAPISWIKDRVKNGAVRVKQANWDRRRVYITVAMLEQLKMDWHLRHEAPEVKRRPNEAWLLLGDAVMVAGVSPATLIRWAEHQDPRGGQLEREMGSTGWLYDREAVRACARRYWATSRFTRVCLPDWLELELQAAARSHEATRHVPSTAIVKEQQGLKGEGILSSSLIGKAIPQGVL